MMRLPQNAQYVVSSATKKWQKKTLCAGETERQEKQKLCTQIPSQIVSDLDLNYIRSYVRTCTHTRQSCEHTNSFYSVLLRIFVLF